MSISEMMELWDDYRRQPVEWIHPSWIERCFEPVRISEGHLQNLLDLPRFHSRLTQLIKDHHDLPDISKLETPSESDLAVMLFPLASIHQLIQACGAVYWANAFSTVVVSGQVNELRNRFGAELYQLALGNRSLAVALKAPETLDELEEAVEADGWLCLASWLAEQQPDIRAWSQLRFPIPRITGPQPDSSRAHAQIARHMAFTLWPKHELMEVQDDRVSG